MYIKDRLDGKSGTRLACFRAGRALALEKAFGFTFLPYIATIA
jgi:hypothetical protein